MFDLVIPCYNPSEDWAENIVTRMEDLYISMGLYPHLILVNDGTGSQNLTNGVQLLSQQKFTFEFIELEANHGKGAALRKGISSTKNDHIIYTDIDLPYTIDSLIDVKRLLEEGYDVVAGTKNKAYYKNVPAIRVFISKILRKGIGLFFRMPVTDTQCGLKGMNIRGRSVFLSTTINRYLFDLEFIYMSFRKNLKVASIPVQLRDGIQFSSMNRGIILQESGNFLKLVFRKSK